MPNPVWTLDQGITNSLLSRFIFCKERFRLYAIEGIRESKPFDKKIEYGSLFHEALEAHYDEEGKDPKDAVLAYKKKLFSNHPTEKEDVAFWARVCLAQFKLYVNNWRLEDSRREWLMLEETFEIPYSLQVGKKTETILLRGKFDGVFRDKKTNAIYLQENKTKGFIDEMMIKQGISRDLQTMIYLTALHTLFKRRQRKPPTGVQYNVVRRPLSEQYAIRRKKSETEKEFIVRIGEVIKAKPGNYFIRNQIPIKPAQLSRFKKRTLNPYLRELVRWWRSIEKDPFDPWDSPYHGERPCNLFDSFNVGMRGDYFDLITAGSKRGLEKISTVFPELEDDKPKKKTK